MHKRVIQYSKMSLIMGLYSCIISHFFFLHWNVLFIIPVAALAIRALRSIVGTLIAYKSIRILYWERSFSRLRRALRPYSNAELMSLIQYIMLTNGRRNCVSPLRQSWSNDVMSQRVRDRRQTAEGVTHFLDLEPCIGNSTAHFLPPFSNLLIASPFVSYNRYIKGLHLNMMKTVSTARYMSCKARYCYHTLSVRLSFRLSVTLVICGHVGWATSKVIARFSITPLSFGSLGSLLLQSQHRTSNRREHLQISRGIGAVSLFSTENLQYLWNGARYGEGCYWSHHPQQEVAYALSLGSEIDNLGWPGTVVTHFVSKYMCFRSPPKMNEYRPILSAAKM